VILLALGVPEETVMEDYLLSGVYRAEENEATLTQVRTVVAAIRGIDPAAVPDADLDGLRALIDVRPEFLQAAFDAVTETYGDVATYLTEGLGLTPETSRRSATRCSNRASAQRTPMRSTTNTRCSFGPITPPAPRAP
jgi:protein-tyrosine phosphatase